ncbi:MAG: ZIP family metal transporter [Treponema sp.]|nr:ZIP family metal transporter [Treponema sp.]
MLMFSAIAGILGTGLGGLASVIMLKRSSENTTCWLLSFAAGVMVSIVCFGLVPETLALVNTAVCLSGLLLGIVIIMVLNRIVDKITITKEKSLKVHRTHEELYHESLVIKNRTKMLRSGTLMLIAIGLHNVPEGIAIGAGGSHNFQLGTLLAVMIALHNIPEGMAIAAPLLAGGVGKWRVIYLTALSGAPTFLGGLIGLLLGRISDFSIAMSLSAAGGAMLYIVFGEIIPQSIVMTSNRTASIVTLFGILLGFIITQV